MSTRVHRSVRIVLAVTIALLIMVSPLCAPFCAATACASGNSAANPGADGCHHSSASADDGSGAIAAPQPCNLKELPTAALRDAMSAMKRHAERTLPLLARDTAADEQLTIQLNPSLLLRDSATSNDKPRATTILRI